MNVMMLDYDLNFSAEIIKKLAEVGVQTLLAFDAWHNTEPQPGCYRFDTLVAYARVCKEEGIKFLFLTPVGTPVWADDSWFLMNKSGNTNSFKNLISGFRPGDPSHLATGIGLVLGLRFFSYWHSESQDYTRCYVQKVRETIEPEGAVCISGIGTCGDFMFPATIYHPSLGVVEESPWWFDDNAKKSRGIQDPDEWFFGERMKIVAARLSWYKEKWLQFAQDPNRCLGNLEIDKVIDTCKNNLKTIMYYVFPRRTQYVVKAVEQAALCPSWVGAEGCKHVVVNTRKALALGFQGVICGPLFCHFGTSYFEDWMYQEIKKANSLERYDVSPT